MLQIPIRLKPWLTGSRENLQQQIIICEQLGKEYLTTNPARANFYARQGLIFAEKHGNALTKARLTHLPGSSFTMLGKYDSAEIYLQKAHKMASTLNDNELEGLTILSLGNLLTRQHRTEEAMARYTEARVVFEKSGDRNNLRRTLGSIAVLFMYQHNYSEAEKYYRETEMLLAELNDQSGLGTGLLGSVKIYVERQNTEKALEYAALSVRAFHLSGEKAFESVAYKELAGIYLEMNELQKAEENGLKSLVIAREAGISRYIANALGMLAQISYRKGDYQLSTGYSFESLNADSTDQETKSALLNLTKCYISLGKPGLE